MAIPPENLSSSFTEAASFLSESSTLTAIPNETKLELYGLYKFLTVSAEPSMPRPSIFSPVERAKYDAWKSAETSWHGKGSQAEARYLEIARSLGWNPSIKVVTEPQNLSREPTAEELLANESEAEDESRSGTSGGLGLVVSVMKREEADDTQSLHTIAIDGNVEELQAFLSTHTDVDVNNLDEYGFTALHLACDRGNLDMVQMLLHKGADIDIKDSDGLSALDLALESGRPDIAELLGR